MTNKQWSDDALAVDGIIAEMAYVWKYESELNLTWGEWQLERANRIVALFEAQIAERDARIAELEEAANKLERIRAMCNQTQTEEKSNEAD